MTRHQRGPNSAHHTHKQKKAQLQEARRRARDREATDEAEDAYEAALVSAANRVPKVVQARLYTYREHRGGAVHVRLRLAIDRQQCAGFVPGLPAGVLPPLPAGVLPPPPPVSSSPHLAELRNADARRARDWAREAAFTMVEGVGLCACAALLQRGAKVNSRTADGSTPLHLACKKDHALVVKVRAR